ncbi:hypothetical protein DL96DRAFT_554607 [Flagelloscypha sp. PMI_526]|nr:hypothetical protein DL96DRAFT_554607 [Flagelloscypha sp. PMI_526]
MADDATVIEPAITTQAIVSANDSTIAHISLYPGRAEVSRLFKVTVQSGQNVVTVNGLPNRMDQSSLRVEGRGNATIQEVVSGSMPSQYMPHTTPLLTELQRKKRRLDKALVRAKSAVQSLETYIGSITADKNSYGDINGIVSTFEDQSGSLDEKIIDLEDEIAVVNSEITTERTTMSRPQDNAQLRMKATVTLLCEEQTEQDIQLLLTYGVTNASWAAAYDIRVDSANSSCHLIYKAKISQKTGEEWKNARLTLETAAPSFKHKLPSLNPWNVTIYQPPPPPPPTIGGTRGRGGFGYLAVSSRARKKPSSGPITEEYSVQDQDMWMAPESWSLDEQAMEHRVVQVTSTGDVNASFEIPGTISIPSDGDSHNVTITKLELPLEREWVSVPRKEISVHMMAKILNESEYTMLAGYANIFLDGVFIGSTSLPGVSPQEKFECSLGLDPTVRTVYAPLQKKSSTASKFLTQAKTSTTVYTQRIEVTNTKPSTTLSSVRIIDHVPVSQNSEVLVKLVKPSLAAIDTIKEKTMVEKVTVQQQPTPVFAYWTLADGSDGKLEWMLPDLPPKERVELLLSWEVTAPEHVRLEWSEV